MTGLSIHSGHKKGCHHNDKVVMRRGATVMIGMSFMQVSDRNTSILQTKLNFFLKSG